MRKFFLFSLAISLFLIAPMDSTGQTKAYEKGQLQINAGIDFLVFPYNYGYFNLYSGVTTSATVPVSANIEYGFHEYISIGGYAGYYSKTWNYNTFRGDRESSFSVVSFGARGTLHATQLMNDLTDAGIDDTKWDLYASLILGIENTSWDHTWDDTRYSPPSSTTNFRIGPIFGARYMFNSNLGAFLEFGRGTYGLGRIGLTFNI